MNWLAPLAQSARALARARSFTVASVLTLAIGIGATTAILSVLDAVVLQPLPYRDPGRLFGAWVAFPNLHFGRPAPQSLATYAVYKQFARTIEGIGLADRVSVNVSDARTADPPARIHAAQVTASVFSLLGATFSRGRGFLESEDVPKGPLVAVISDGLWRARFGADPGIVGKKIQVDGQLREIVGVASPHFHFPDFQTEIWLPAAMDLHAVFAGGFFHQSFVRLRKGVTPAQAQRELDELLPRAGELFAAIGPGISLAQMLKVSGARAELHPLRDDVVGPFHGVLWIASAATMLLLVIAAANVANLLMSRAEQRRREMAVRVALGAGRVHIVGRLLSEVAVIAATGGMAGCVLATAGVSYFRHAAPPTVPRLAEISADYRLVLIALGSTIAIAAFCCVVPAIQFRARSLPNVLRDGSRGGTSGRDRQRVRRSLVAAQVAFAVVLVTGAALLLHSAQRLRSVQPGFEPDGVVTAWISLPPTAYPGDSDVVRFTEQIVDRLTRRSSVRGAAITSKLPLDVQGRGYGPVVPDNDQTPAGSAPPIAQVVAVSGGYFDTMQIPLIAGHTFRPWREQVPHEAIVDRRLAIQYWGDSTGRAALGRKIRFAQGEAPWFTVVGVAGLVRDTSLWGPSNSVVYVPESPDPDPNTSLVSRIFAVAVRASGNPRLLRGLIEHEVVAMDPALPVFDARLMRDVVEQSMTRLTFVTTVLTVVAGVALSLAAVGLYGVIAYLVSLRTREIGVRIALGAQPRAVSRMVTGQGVVLTAAGIVLGMSVFLSLARYLRSAIGGVAPTDPLTIAEVSGMLLAVSVCASWVPARRAANVDPVQSLGAE